MVSMKKRHLKFHRCFRSPENDTLPILQKQFAETQKSIDNMLNAIQQGIFTTSTKERLEALEREKSDLSVQIIKEELSRPNLTKEQILFWIHKFRKLNPKKLEHRRRLINSFLNSVYLFDDKIIIDCNYKDGTETITFEEIENSALGSDLTSLAAPNKRPYTQRVCGFLFGFVSKGLERVVGEIALREFCRRF